MKDLLPFLYVFVGLTLLSFCLIALHFAQKKVSRHRAIHSRPRSVIRVESNKAAICAWCADSTAGTAWAKRMGLMPSHTICPTCRAKQFPDLKLAS